MAVVSSPAHTSAGHTALVNTTGYHQANTDGWRSLVLSISIFFAFVIRMIRPSLHFTLSWGWYTSVLWNLKQNKTHFEDVYSYAFPWLLFISEMNEFECSCIFLPDCTFFTWYCILKIQNLHNPVIKVLSQRHICHIAMSNTWSAISELQAKCLQLATLRCN